MKILVDALPATCGECQFCADAMMMTPLGVQKQICLCTVSTTLIPQDPQKPPRTVDKNSSPYNNSCVFDSTNSTVSSSGKIIL